MEVGMRAMTVRMEREDSDGNRHIDMDREMLE